MKSKTAKGLPIDKIAIILKKDMNIMGEALREKYISYQTDEDNEAMFLHKILDRLRMVITKMLDKATLNATLELYFVAMAQNGEQKQKLLPIIDILKIIEENRDYLYFLEELLEDCIEEIKWTETNRLKGN